MTRVESSTPERCQSKVDGLAVLEVHVPLSIRVERRARTVHIPPVVLNRNLEFGIRQVRLVGVGPNAHPVLLAWNWEPALGDPTHELQLLIASSRIAAPAKC